MKMTEMFLAQLEREAPLTRSAVERVPAGRSDWKPHEKSMPLGTLASLVASMPSWIATMIDQNELDIGAGGGGQSAARTSSELMPLLDKSVAAARRALSSTTDEHLMTDGVFSHLAHHRGQLTVYLRLNNIAVPAIYGATADEGH